MFGRRLRAVLAAWSAVLICSAFPYVWDSLVDGHWERSTRVFVVWTSGIVVIGCLTTWLALREERKSRDR